MYRKINYKIPDAKISEIVRSRVDACLRSRQRVDPSELILI
jgi:hypothetical protein